MTNHLANHDRLRWLHRSKTAAIQEACMIMQAEDGSAIIIQTLVQAKPIGSRTKNCQSRVPGNQTVCGRPKLQKEKKIFFFFGLAPTP